MAEEGHRYSWTGPKQGWPEFDENGKIVRRKQRSKAKKKEEVKREEASSASRHGRSAR